MFENLIYPVIGFVGTLSGLEAAWHFIACMYKELKLALGDCTIIEKHLINDFAENEEERSRSY